MRCFLFALAAFAVVSGVTATGVHAQSSKRTSMTTPSPTATPALSPALPLFYKELVPFDKNVHRDLKVARNPETYAFSAESDIIPLVFSEVAFAAMHYPIVFLDSGGAGVPTLVAMVGNGNRKNQFVDSKGQWAQGHYVPAWVRRYPFFAMKTSADGQPLLGIDTTAARLKSSKGEPLLDKDANPTPLLQEILVMNIEYQQAGARTNQLAEQLQKAGLLEPVVLKVQAPQKNSSQTGEAPAITVGGFLVVNEAKLVNLDNDKLAELHKSGALSLAYGNLISMQHLRKIFESASN
jgi:hypothetical protein